MLPCIPEDSRIGTHLAMLQKSDVLELYVACMQMAKK